MKSAFEWVRKIPSMITSPTRPPMKHHFCTRAYMRIPMATTPVAIPAVISEATKMPLPLVAEYGHQSAWNALVPVKPRIVSSGWSTSTHRIWA